MSSEKVVGDSPKSYSGIARDWLSNYRWAAWMLLSAIVIQLILNVVMATHTYIYPFDIYSPGQFDHLTWWMYAGDAIIHVYLLYRISAFLAGRTGTESLFKEIVSNLLWVYFFATSAMMVIL